METDIFVDCQEEMAREIETVLPMTLQKQSDIPEVAAGYDDKMFLFTILHQQKLSKCSVGLLQILSK